MSKSPSTPSKDVPVGTIMKGNDSEMWITKRVGSSLRWIHLPNETTSWILFSLRSILEDEYIRNKIIASDIDIGLETKLHIELGPTFTGFYDQKAVDTYVTDLFNDKNKHTLHVFTVSNIPHKKTFETHFQTFLYKNKYLYGINPSYDNQGFGIYATRSGDHLEKLAKKHNVYFQWIPLSNPCQTTFKDVFCQTWSLYLLIHTIKKFIKKDETPIEIPCSQNERYSILLNFYKQCIQIPDVKEQFLYEYAYNINHASEIDDRIKLTTEQKQRLLKINPLKYIEQMNEFDMY